ncbi:GNAT family N-acetyltransferase [Kaarinaea lacus]
MAIRPAEEREYTAISRLITSEEELFLVFPGGKYPFTVDQVQQLAQQRKALTVLEKDGQIIGFANLYDHIPRQWIFIGNVVVCKSQRGKGLGGALINHMLGLAFDEYSVSETRISVFCHNTPALILYSRFGFKPYDIEQRNDFNNRQVALLHMRLAINDWKSLQI